jgi:hypothetical protein
MPNNSSERLRQKLYEEYEDSLFKLVMHDVAEKEGQLFLEEKEKLKNDPEFLPSQEAAQKFSQQLDAQLKKSQVYGKRRRIRQTLNRVAVAMNCGRSRCMAMGIQPLLSAKRQCSRAFFTFSSTSPE